MPPSLSSSTPVAPVLQSIDSLLSFMDIVAICLIVLMTLSSILRSLANNKPVNTSVVISGLMGVIALLYMPSVIRNIMGTDMAVFQESHVASSTADSSTATKGTSQSGQPNAIAASSSATTAQPPKTEPANATKVKVPEQQGPQTAPAESVVKVPAGLIPYNGNKAQIEVLVDTLPAKKTTHLNEEISAN